MSTDGGALLNTPGPSLADDTRRPDHRGSWLPTFSMIRTRHMELRKRRGLNIALSLVTIGLPAIFLLIRLLLHAFAPKSYGPAGGYQIFGAFTAQILFIFGFICAATLGCTAGSVDLSEGVFRHLVVTGRSRVSLYLARIPAGLGLIVPMVAVGFTIVCLVCVFAAPKTLNYDGVTVPAGLSEKGLVSWAEDHSGLVVCGFNYSGPGVNVPCGPHGIVVGPGGNPGASQATPAQIKAAAVSIAKQNYVSYSQQFLYPSDGFMVRSGLWLELEVAIGFIVGLGLSSLIGQRTVAVVLMIVLEIVLTPVLSRNSIPHMINLQRGVVGLATAHLEPAALPPTFGGGGGGPGGQINNFLVPETRLTAILVIVGWLVGWTVIGAWRMARRDV